MLKTIATIALLATTAPAIAQPAGETRTVHVSYADLDLRHAGDVKTLDRRLRAAIGTVCPAGVATDMLVSPAVQQCRKTAHAALADQRATAIAKAAGTTQLALNTDAR